MSEQSSRADRQIAPYCITLIKKVFRRIGNWFFKGDHIKYAKRLGVSVGEGSRFVDNPEWGTEPYLITIGKHVLISGQVAFINHDGSTWLFRESGPYKDTYKFGPITIGDNCFIGFRSIILPNVNIGNDCIIAAGSIVNKDVPSGEVWGGVPARFISKTEDYAQKCFNSRRPYDVERLSNDKKAEMIRVCFGSKKVK